MITTILTSTQIQQKLDRITYQIAEDCFEEKMIYIIGIHGNGYKLAKIISQKIQQINQHEVKLVELFIDKKDPLKKEITMNIPNEEITDKCIILVDDVVNSGKTMQYALTKILEQSTKFIKTVALVDRKHRNFPIRCDFVGLTLSTTLQEHVEVEIGDTMSAYLK